MRCKRCGQNTVSDASRYDGEFPCMNPCCGEDARSAATLEERISELEQRVAELESQMERQCSTDAV